jgi:group I intron endonuclease
MFHIYIIHNILNNKIYVGKSKNPHKRWIKHVRISRGNRNKEKFYIHRAIAKYGEENFTFSVIQELSSEQEADLAEEYWIKFFNSRDNKFGYNLTDGGEGVSGRIVSEATRQKMRKKAIGRRHSKETLLNMSGDNNHRSKLSSNNIKDIRYKYNSLKYNLISLSKEYDVSSRTIARVIYNIDWYDKNYVPPIPRKTNSFGKPKLTWEKVKQIRQMYQSGSNFLELSKLFNVTTVNISMIVKKKIWRNND